MKRLLLIFALCGSAFAADIYFGPTSAGGNTGANCANAYAYNDGTHGWSQSAQQVAGNNLHVCSGTYTLAANGVILSAVNAGTSGSRINWVADQGAAIFQAPYFSLSGAFEINNQYWTLNGVSYSNLTIQNTDNGSPTSACIAGTGGGGTCGSQQGSMMVVVNTNPANLIVENMSWVNGYVYATGTTDSWCFSNCQGSGGIVGAYYLGDSNVTLDHISCNYFWNCFNGWGNNIVVSYYHCNNSAACSWWIGGQSPTATGDVYHDGLCENIGTWYSGAGDTFHLECLHIENDPDTLVGMMIYNNKFGSAASTGAGDQTAYVYMSGSNSGLLFFNNFCYFASTDFLPCLEGGNTFPNATIVNNTSYGGNAISGQIGFTFDGTTTGTVQKNNVIVGGNSLVAQSGTYAAGGLDYNAYDSGPPQPFGYQGTSETFAGWTSATGQDSHAIYQSLSTLGVNSNGTLQSTSPLRGAGTNLTGLGVAQLDSGAPQNFGVTGSCGTGCIARPSSGAWDMGAYPYSSAGPTVTPAPALGMFAWDWDPLEGIAP